MKRIVKPELLDTLPPDDPRAIRSRLDLRRVNWWMGNHAIMADTLMDHSSDVPKRITELGAGDGKFLLRIAEKISTRWPDTMVTLLDLQKNISDKTIADFKALGWQAKPLVADVFEWSPTDDAGVIITNLFLHHFEDARLAELLKKISKHAKLFVAVEPHRFHQAFACAQLLRLIGCNDVTLHDAAISIRAGFIGQEISELWPHQQNWQLTERRAGFFSHLFIARRLG